MAATLLDLLEDEELVKRARAEFEERMKGRVYKTLAPTKYEKGEVW